MPVSEITSFGDWMVEYIQEYIQSNYVSGDPDTTVERVYEMVQDVGNVDGRKIHLFTVRYLDGGPATRRDGYYDVTIVVDFLERYTLEGKYTKEWADARVEFVEQIFNLLSDNTSRFGAEENGGRPYWCQEIENQNVADEATLRENNAFWSRLEVTYRRTK